MLGVSYLHVMVYNHSIVTDAPFPKTLSTRSFIK